MDAPKQLEKCKIATGCRVGNLTVVERTEERKNGYMVWKCRCDCGNEIQLDTRYLQRGTISDCGCIKRIKARQQKEDGILHPGQKDLTGMRFGKLVCIEPTKERGKRGGAVWLCQCDCGKQCYAVSTHMTRGYKKSCGCISRPPLKKYLGKRFGMLTVVEYAGKQDGMHRWRCRCDCGKESVVGQTLLQDGRTKSCGCLRKEIYKENLQIVNGTSVTILEANKRRTISTNKSGYTGVHRHSRSGKWVAQITFKGKTYHLGVFEDLEDAVEARKRGEEMYDRFLEWYYEGHPERKGLKAGTPAKELYESK